MKKLILLVALSVGMIGCVQKEKMADWKVEITSPSNISSTIIKGKDYEFKDNSMITNSIVKEFPSNTLNSVRVVAWGDGIITIKIFKDGVMKELSGDGIGSGLILEY